MVAQGRIPDSTVPAFGPTGTLTHEGRRVKTTVNIHCTDGQTIQFSLTITQRGATGVAFGDGRCTGKSRSYPVTAFARRGMRFSTGNADACASAINRKRKRVVDTRTWCRKPGLTLSN